MSNKSSNMIIILILIILVIGLFPVMANVQELPVPTNDCESSVNNLKEDCLKCLQSNSLGKFKDNSGITKINSKKRKNNPGKVKKNPDKVNKSKCIYTSYMQMLKNYQGCFAELQSIRNQYCDLNKDKKSKCLKIRIALKNNCQQCRKKNKNKDGRELCFYHSFYRYLEKNNTCLDGLKKTFKRHCNKRVPAVKIKPACPTLIASMKTKCKRCRIKTKKTKKKSFTKCVDNFYYRIINKNFQCYKKLKEARKKICSF